MHEEILKQIATFTGKSIDEITKAVINEDKVNTDALGTLLRDKLNSVITPEEKIKEIQDNFYKKGQSETFKKVNEGLKTVYPKLEITDDGKFDDVLTKIKQLKVELPDEEKIKASPVYVALEQSINEKYVPKADFEAKEKEFDSYKRQVDRGKKTATLTEVMKEMLSKDYKIPETPEIAERQLNAFGTVFNDYELEEIPGKNDFILIDKDGKRLEDADKNLITARKKIEMDAPTWFEKKVEGTPTPPGQTDDYKEPARDKDGKFQFKEPASREEYEATRTPMSGEMRLEYKKFAEPLLKEKGL